ncbi:hypothetical protein [Microbulbifer yueqingensis]|uniref:Uncharacterized protein n=1 Tax=Microbulbifer yueqingensis TaxID=658219 RepID=A0A1G9CT22_9GAMM|nr:hypothetical protein [Microbulbifer yueqingensis]SDK54554.1 hypothetical protein SAMN05216212_2609 [Microbulbifer yueqingensis]
MNDDRHQQSEDLARDLADDWSELECLWQEQSPETPAGNEIIQRVRRQERWLRINTVLEWLVAIALVTFALVRLFSAASTENILLATVILLLVIWALNFSISNRRGLQQPQGETVQAYTELALLRLKRRRRGVRFAWLLYFVEVSLFILWELAERFAGLDTGFNLFSPSALLTALVVTVIMVAWSLVVWRQTDREKRVIEALGH